MTLEFPLRFAIYKGREHPLEGTPLFIFHTWKRVRWILNFANIRLLNLSLFYPFYSLRKSEPQLASAYLPFRQSRLIRNPFQLLRYPTTILQTQTTGKQ